MQYEKDGRTFEFSFDPDIMADYEEAHPGYTLASDLGQLEDKGAMFSVMRRMATFIGTDFKTLKADGLDIGTDLAEIVRGCVKEMGF